MATPPFPPPPPVPVPPRKKTSIWPFLAAAVGLLVIVALAATAVTAFSRIKKRQAERKVALEQMEKEITAARDEVADTLQKGENPSSQDSMGRMKEALEKSAAHMTGGDAAAARALAAFLTRMQTEAQTYEAAAGRMIEAKVLSFEVADRATLADHRKLLVEFSEANKRLTDMVRRADVLARAELVAAKVPERMIETTMNGFNKGRPQREVQLRIRDYDRVLAESGLAVCDLLEKDWGKWHRDAATGQLTFQTDATLEAFNGHVTKIQEAADGQARAQQELAAKLKLLGK